VGKKKVEFEEFDTIEENLKDYKKKRTNPFVIIFGIVSFLASLHSLALSFPLHIESIIPGVIAPGIYLNHGYEGLNLGAPTEGSMIIDGVEVDLNTLKEEYGIFYQLVIPMSQKEVENQDRKIRLFERYQNYQVTPHFGYAIQFDFDEQKEYYELVSDYVRVFKEMSFAHNSEFMTLVQDITTCRYNEYFKFDQCGISLYWFKVDYPYHPLFSTSLIERYEDEIELKSKLLMFEVFKEYVTSKGIDLRESLPNPNVWTRR
jgi:hypothetical protein